MIIRLLLVMAALFPTFISADLNAQCTAVIGSNLTELKGCEVLTIQFIDESENVVSRTWNFGDGSGVSYAQNPVHSFDAGVLGDTTYTVSLTIVCSSGTNTATKTVTVYAQPKIDFSSNKESVCAITDSVCMENLTVFNTASTYSWNFGDGTISSKYDPCKTYSTPGTYDVILTVTNENGCLDTKTKTDFIRVEPVPSTAFSVSSFAGCVPFNVRVNNITDTIEGEVYSNWTWDFGDGSDPVYDFEASAHTYTKPGEYTIKLGATNSLGCYNFSTQKITVNPSPVARFQSSSPDCQNDFSQIEFTGSYASNPSFTWNFDTAIIVNGSGEGPYNVKWGDPGNKIVTLTLEEDGCSSTFADKVQVTPIAQVYLGITASDDSICAGQMVRFTATPDNFAGYQFYKNNTLLQNSAENTYEGTDFSNGDKVYVEITDLNGCTEIISDTIEVHVRPTPYISLTNNTANDSACFNDPIVFTASPSNYENYQFFINNTEIQTGSDNDFLTSSLEQGDRVTAKASLSECTGPTSNTEIITLLDALPAPQVFCGGSSPNTINFAWDSVQGAVGFEVSINNGPYQNPNSGTLGLYHSLTGLTEGELHSIRVKTLNDYTCGVEQISRQVTCEARGCEAIEYNSGITDLNICEGEKAALSISAVSIENYEVSWNSGAFSNDTVYSFTATSDIEIPVEVRNINEPSCPTVTKYYNINVTPKGSVSISSSANGDKICGNSDVTFEVIPQYYEDYILYDNGKQIMSSDENIFDLQEIKNNHYYFATAKDDACRLISDTLTIDVEQPLETPVVNFFSSTEKSITFSWDQVPGATGYQVSQDNGPFQTPSSGSTGLSHVVGPLNPGSAVSLSVIALGDGLCGNSDISQPAIGFAETCSSITFDIKENYKICQGDTIELRIMNLSLVNYSVTWGQLAPSRKQSILLQPMRDTVIFVNVKNTQQPYCAGVTKFVEIQVTEKPVKLNVASKNLNEACVGSLIEFNGSPGGYDIYEFYNYGNLIQQNAYNSVKVLADQEHFSIRARAINDECFGEFSDPFDATILPPLPKPQVNCGPTSQNSITFMWDPTPDAESYLVSVNNQEYIVPSTGPEGLTHTISGLSAEEKDSIRVKAIGPNICSNSQPSTQVTCIARDCNMIDYNIDAYQTVCQDDQITLEVSDIVVSDYAIAWEDGNYQNSTSSSLTCTEDSVVNVSLIDNNQPNCPSVDKYFEIKVTKTVPVELSSNASDNSICPDDTLTLTVTPGNFERYLFLHNTDTLQDGVANSLQINGFPSNYGVTAEVYQNNCPIKSQELITTLISLPDITLSASATGDVCRNETISVTSSAGFEKYLYSNGDYNIKETIENTTQIQVNDAMITVTGITQENCTAMGADTLFFNILEPPQMGLSCSSDTICFGEYTSYYAYPLNLLAYSFYNGDIQLQSSESDFYATDSLRSGDTISVVGLGSNGCYSDPTSTQFPYLMPYPDYQIGNSKEGICLGDSLKLFVETTMTSSGFTFEWRNGETSDTIIVSPNNSTDYRLFFSDGGRCNDVKIDDQLIIVDTQPPPVAEAGDSVTICINDSTLLEASGGISYSWTPDSTLDDPNIFNPFAFPEVTTTYFVTATNTYCKDVDSVLVIVDLCLEELSNPVPQIITPNGDDINDYWEITNIDYFENNAVKIFNRWGNEVYSANPYNNEWNGKTNQGVDLPDGTYFYVIKLGNGTKEVTGFIIIHR